MNTDFGLPTPLQCRPLRERFPAGSQWHGSLADWPMPRLAELGIVCDKAEAGAVLFPPSKDPQAPLHLKLTLRALTRSPCGRCTDDVAAEQGWEREFVLYSSGDQADAALDLEALADPISDEDGLSLGDLFEDEILMALTEPLRHETCIGPMQGVGSEAPAADASPSEPTQRPFSGLADLLQGRQSKD